MKDKDLIENHPYLDAHFNNTKYKHEDRENDLAFNTSLYWWCWYNIERDILYNQYGRIVGSKKYLIDRKLMSEDFKVLQSCEKPIEYDK